MAITDYKHLRISDTETGDAADDLNNNFRELAERTGQIVRVSGNSYTAYHPSADTDAARGTALEAALTAATAGDTILVGTGTYAVSAAMGGVNDLSIIGMGRGSVIQRSGIVFDMTSVSGVTFQNVRIRGQNNFDACTYIQFRFCWLQGNGQTNCVRAVNTSGDSHHFKFTDCQEISGATSDNIYLSKVDWLEYENNSNTDAGQDGLHMEEGGASSTNDSFWSGATITGNHFRNNGRYGAYLNGAHDPSITGNSWEDQQNAGIYVRAPIQTLLTGNTFERNNQAGTGTMAGVILEIVDSSGLDAAGTEAQAVVVGNQMGLEEVGLLITGTFDQGAVIKVSDNLFLFNPGIEINSYRAAYHIAVRGNIFDPGGGSPGTAISAAGTSTTAGDRLKITENDIDGFSTGIEVDGLTNVLVTRNDILNTTTDQSLLNSATVRTS